MFSLGFRISPTDWTYVVLDGTVGSPTVVAAETIKIPPGMGESESLAWFRDEVAGLISQYPVAAARFRKREPKARGKDKDIARRYQLEGVLREAVFTFGDVDAIPLVQSQIKSVLEFEGKANQVKEIPATVPALAGLTSEKQADACVTAMCGLPE